MREGLAGSGFGSERETFHCLLSTVVGLYLEEGMTPARFFLSLSHTVCTCVLYVRVLQAWVCTRICTQRVRKPNMQSAPLFQTFRGGTRILRGPRCAVHRDAPPTPPPTVTSLKSRAAPTSGAQHLAQPSSRNLASRERAASVCAPHAACGKPCAVFVKLHSGTSLCETILAVLEAVRLRPVSIHPSSVPLQT